MAKIDTRRWAVLSPLLDECAELDAAARTARLARLREDDAALADELAALLAEQVALEDDAFLEGQALGADVAATLAGQALGAYTLLEPLGAGGMGSVWLAQRSDGRFEGQVAVKLLNLALIARGGAERFAREGSMLARLAHPHIARLLDAGVTPGGQPYLVLEHVAGEPIDRWCERHQLGVQARVRLMLDVLAAVAHAHSKLVLHRDLKPANILVTGDGQVKLLDFGIAKLLDDEALPATATEMTQLAGRAFTPDYAAPEQVQGGDVSTATDVYALGVLLYVLLGGAHPTGKPTHTPVQRLRSVVETEPQRLSDAAARTTATAQGETPAQRARALRGDLDNIVAKALKKSPAERYPTAAALADDLQRFLNHEPVSARADTWAYRSGMFVRRHRWAVGAGSITLLALVAGVIGTAWQAIEARRERDQALFQAERASARGNLFNQLLTALGSADRPLTQREILERSVQLVEKQFGKDPRIAVDLLLPIAGQYMSLNDTNNELAVMHKAAAIAHASGDAQLIAKAACNTVDTEVRRGDLGAARKQLRIGLEAAVRAGGGDRGTTHSCLRAEADVLQEEGDLDGAVARIVESLALDERSSTTRGYGYRSMLSYLHLLHRRRGDYAASHEVIKKEQQLNVANGNTDSVNHIGALREEAVTLQLWGEISAAGAIIDSLVPRWRGLREDGTAPTWFENSRAVLKLRLGDAAAAAALLTVSLERARSEGNHAAVVSAEFVLAQALFALGRLDAAQEMLNSVKRGSAIGLGGFQRITPEVLQAELWLVRGQAALAAGVIDAELARLGHPGAKPSLAIATALRVATRVQLALGNAQRALEHAAASVETSEHVARNAAASADVGEALLLMAQAQQALGHAAEATATAQRAGRSLAGGLGEAHALTRQARALEAAAPLAR